MKFKVRASLLFFLFLSPSSFSKSFSDSLFNLLIKENKDTSKVRLLNLLAIELRSENPAKSLSYAREAALLSEKINYKKGAAEAYLNIASVYDDESNFAEALKFYFKALKFTETLDYKGLLMQNCNGIGIIYSRQNKHSDALKYFLRSAKIAEDLKIKSKIASAYNNLGICYKNLGNYKQAREYYDKALKAFIEMNFKRGVAASYNNLGIINTVLGDYKAAKEYCLKGIKVFEEINDLNGIGGSYVNLAEVYYKQGNNNEAIKNYSHALDISYKTSAKLTRKDAYDGLSKSYAAIKNYNKAFEYLERFHQLKDSIITTEAEEVEQKFENEKNQKQIELLKQKEEIQKLKVTSQQEQLRANRLVTYAIVLVGLLFLILLVVIYNRYLIKQKANKELEEKKKQIQDSINYAQQIQSAILPSQAEIQKAFPNSFILYLPKDVVSGDFYFFAGVDNKKIVAACDCTGHGVPGAFMSMIGMDKLNHAVIEQKLTEPHHILSSLNKGIRQALKQNHTGSNSRDGMDISLISIDTKNLKLNYSGANRPAYIIRNNSSELIELAPNKASIAGYTEENYIFNNSEVNLEKGDTIYLFSDGYADQFGGEKGKKFTTKKFKEKLKAIRSENLSIQKKILENDFFTWKGDLEQVDDILVIGIRV